MNKPNNKDVANAILDVIQYGHFDSNAYNMNTEKYCLKHNILECDKLGDIPGVTHYGYAVLNSIIGISDGTPNSCDDCPIEREYCYDSEDYNCSDGSGYQSKPSSACLYYAEQQVCEDCGNSTDKAKMKDIGCDHCNVDGKTWINGMGDRTEIEMVKPIKQELSQYIQGELSKISDLIDEFHRISDSVHDAIKDGVAGLDIPDAFIVDDADRAVNNIYSAIERVKS